MGIKEDQEREEFQKAHYPRWIYKDGRGMVVQNAFEHAEYYEKGWSGPPIFFNEVPSLEEDIARTEIELEQKKKLLIKLKGTNREEGDENKTGSSAAGDINNAEENKLKIVMSPDNTELSPTPEEFVCEDCGKSFPTREGLTGHMSKHAKRGK